MNNLLVFSLIVGWAYMVGKVPSIKHPSSKTTTATDLPKRRSDTLISRQERINRLYITMVKEGNNAKAAQARFIMTRLNNQISSLNKVHFRHN